MTRFHARRFSIRAGIAGLSVAVAAGSLPAQSTPRPARQIFTTPTQRAFGMADHDAVRPKSRSVPGCSGNYSSSGNFFVGTPGASPADYANQEWSGVMGGYGNEVCTAYAGIGVGIDNTISSGESTSPPNDAFIAGGNGNYISGYDSFVGSGYENTISGNDAFLGGGIYGLATGKGSFVGAGGAEYSTASGATAEGGNIASGEDSFVGAGDLNQISAAADGSFIGAGGYHIASQGLTTPANTISSVDSFIGAGDQNAVNGSLGFVGAGSANVIASESAGTYSSFIGSGTGNGIQSYEAFVGAGSNNVVSGFDSFIGAGLGNRLSGTVSFLGGGSTNSISAHEGFIGSGYGNSVTGNGSFIGAGGDMTAANPNNQVSGEDSFVGAGDKNAVGGAEAFVGSGYGNTVNGTYASILGGYGNSAKGEYAAIAGGYGNTASAELTFAAGYHADATHAGSFVWSDYKGGSALLKDGAANEFLARASGGVYFYSNEAASSGVVLTPGSGTWANLSDRNAKTAIAPIDDESVLAKVAALPIDSWQYKSEKGVRHVGPMAQDFYAAFGTGVDDRHITSIDEDGVALAAIKALHRENVELQSRLAALEAKVATLSR
jgi:hypothetical protein